MKAKQLYDGLTNMYLECNTIREVFENTTSEDTVIIPEQNICLPGGYYGIRILRDDFLDEEIGNVHKNGYGEYIVAFKYP